jgi:DNA-binding NarL/FixJ family response regulator
MSFAAPVPVLVASASPAYAAGLAAFLAPPEFAPSVAHTLAYASALVEARPPALAIVGWRLADGPGTDLIPALRRRAPELPVLVALDDGARDRQIAALVAGASGCLLADWTRDAVLEAVGDALAGVSRVAADVVRELADRARAVGPPEDPLSPRERVVARMMRQGLTDREIALDLGVSWHTVRSQSRAVLRKLGARSRRELGGLDARREARPIPTAGAPGR